MIIRIEDNSKVISFINFNNVNSVIVRKNSLVFEFSTEESMRQISYSTEEEAEKMAEKIITSYSNNQKVVTI